MRRRHTKSLFLAALALAAGLVPSALISSAMAQVLEPGDPGYIPPAETEQVPDVPPDTATPRNEGGMRPVPNPPGGPSWASEETQEEAAPPQKGTPLAPKRQAAPATAQQAPARKTEADDPGDFLCTRAPAGKAVPVPPPFNQWLVRVCSPRGQALVPVLGEAWVAHNSADPVSILAMPPGAVPPPSTGAFDARYDIRFESLEGGMTTGERKERAAALLKTAMGQETPPAYDEIWQIDAVSNVAETRYNLFFYLEGKRPGHIIACLDQCRQALYLDVLKGQEAKEVLAR